MTVAELIAILQGMPQDARVYVDGCPDGEPCTPEPQYCDWGNPGNPDRGVYL